MAPHRRDTLNGRTLNDPECKYLTKEGQRVGLPMTPNPATPSITEEVSRFKSWTDWHTGPVRKFIERYTGVEKVQAHPEVLGEDDEDELLPLRAGVNVSRDGLFDYTDDGYMKLTDDAPAIVKEENHVERYAPQPLAGPIEKTCYKACKAGAAAAVATAQATVLAAEIAAPLVKSAALGLADRALGREKSALAQIYEASGYNFLANPTRIPIIIGPVTTLSLVEGFEGNNNGQRTRDRGSSMGSIITLAGANELITHPRDAPLGSPFDNFALEGEGHDTHAPRHFRDIATLSHRAVDPGELLPYAENDEPGTEGSGSMEDVDLYGDSDAGSSRQGLLDVAEWEDDQAEEVYGRLEPGRPPPLDGYEILRSRSPTMLSQAEMRAVEATARAEVKKLRQKEAEEAKLAEKEKSMRGNGKGSHASIPYATSAGPSVSKPLDGASERKNGKKPMYREENSNDGFEDANTTFESTLSRAIGSQNTAFMNAARKLANPQREISSPGEKRTAALHTTERKRESRTENGSFHPQEEGMTAAATSESGYETDVGQPNSDLDPILSARASQRSSVASTARTRFRLSVDVSDYGSEEDEEEEHAASESTGEFAPTARTRFPLSAYVSDYNSEDDEEDQHAASESMGEYTRLLDSLPE
ncbi:hypothetical protein LTR66_002369 [Elasticomyces elasticus]|nr:hypothetical protein LTR66_002369 [Elasticomyces elasticus]KAK5009992.1 hypothetical protein LTR28_012319 [Elasticomyces elasticus]